MTVFEKAKWIWYSNVDTPDDYCEFYFKLPAKDSAYINLSCDGNYTLFVNGEYIASNQYGDFEHYKVYDKIDLGAHLTEKENIIGVLVHHTGKGFSRYKPYKPGLIFEVISNDACVLSSGKDIMCRQSKAYKSGFCRFISSQLGYGYSYDSTKEDEWPLGKGEGFFNATIIDKEATFFARPIQKQQLGTRFEGKLHTNGDGYQIYDLGKEVVGHLFFEIEAEKETNINIAYHEYLLENGRVKR
ncbi:MAG: family 78 glycoside hydrolase catalytic domain, partial [Clostridia bacterium]|nr:family 78 glycoside hydrolase catalytic domain [Clostridia bacterium]